jgi:hypothetical protein
MVLVRKLTLQGINAFEQFISELRSDPTKSVPVNILTHPTTSEELPVQLSVEDKTFQSRLQLGEYLYKLFSSQEAMAFDRDPAVWGWLSLFYFDQLCPPTSDSTRKIGEIARYVPSVHAFRYYRHLLAGPYHIYKAYRDNPGLAQIVLFSPVDTITDYTEQLASRQDIVQNKAAIAAATRLYFNPQSGKAKRGAAPNQHKPGTLRRFADLINQLDPTFDLYSMDAVQLLSKLPAEFDAYRP